MNPIGGTLILFFTPYLLSKGRQRTILISAIITILSAIFSLSGSELFFMVGRFLTGISGGMYGSCFSLYNKEVSPDELMASGGAMN
jgi:uncharacterized membrane protein YgaE (UPF0421/DUF939 family)